MSFLYIDNPEGLSSLEICDDPEAVLQLVLRITCACGEKYELPLRKREGTCNSFDCDFVTHISESITVICSNCFLKVNMARKPGDTTTCCSCGHRGFIKKMTKEDAKLYKVLRRKLLGG